MAALLLHVTDSVQTVTTVDGTLIALGALVVAAASAVIWARCGYRGARALRRPKVRRRLFAAVAAASMVAAVSPSVLPYDHLVAVSHESTHDAIHTAHCHAAPASCADAPVTAGPGELMGSRPLVVIPPLIAVLLLTGAVVLVGTPVRPTLRPPVMLERAALV